MAKRNPFQVGDYVSEKTDKYGECWEVREIEGQRCLIADVGEKMSGIIQRWVWASELEPFVDDDEDEYDE